MRSVKRVLASVGVPVVLGIMASAVPARAALISGWGAESDATGGTVTDTTGSLGAGTFNTGTPTGNLAPRADLASTLTLTNVGDQIVFTGQVAMATGDNGNESFRMCLVDSNGAALGTLSSSVWSGSTPTGWLGYLVEIGNLVNGNGTNVIDRHNSGNTSAWFSTSANATILNSQANTTIDNAPDTFNFNVTLTLASATSIGISYSFANVGGSVNLTGSTTDTSPTNFAFNAVGFLENTSSGGAATYSNVAVSYVPAVPEPASAGTLGLVSLCLLARRGRSSAE